MKSLRFRRIGALWLALGLLAGLEAKAHGLAMCPMHQSAEHDAHRGHQGHHAHPHDAKSVCNCLDACQTGCGNALIKTGAPRLALVAEETWLAHRDAAVSGPVSLRAYFLPFALAPPSLS